VTKKRRQDSDQDRSDRVQRDALTRIENSAAEESALDAAVRKSIKLHGP